MLDFPKITFSFGKWLIGLRRFAVAVYTMTSSSSLALSKVYNCIWTAQTQNLPILYAVQIRLFRITLIQIYQKLRNRDLDEMAKYCSQGDTLWRLPVLCKSTRQWEDLHISAFDVLDRMNSPDTELFISIRKKYFKAKGIFGRFLSPLTVKTIEAIRVRSLQVTYRCM